MSGKGDLKKYSLEDFFHTIENIPPAARLKWETTSKKLIKDCFIFNINQIHRKNIDGREGNFVEVDSPNWALMVPYFIDKKGVPRFVMVQQYRHGLDNVTLEFPAGLVDEGEDPCHAAYRELREETGLKCGKCTLLGNVNPNPAFMNNRANFFLMEDLSIEGKQELDANEQIDILTMPVEEVMEKLGTGVYDNGVMLIAMYFFQRYAVKKGIKLSKE